MVLPEATKSTTHLVSVQQSESNPDCMFHYSIA